MVNAIHFPKCFFIEIVETNLHNLLACPTSQWSEIFIFFTKYSSFSDFLCFFFRGGGKSKVKFGFQFETQTGYIKIERVGIVLYGMIIGHIIIIEHWFWYLELVTKMFHSRSKLQGWGEWWGRYWDFQTLLFLYCQLQIKQNIILTGNTKVED